MDQITESISKFFESIGDLFSNFEAELSGGYNPEAQQLEVKEQTKLE